MLHHKAPVTEAVLFVRDRTPGKGVAFAALIVLEVFIPIFYLVALHMLSVVVEVAKPGVRQFRCHRQHQGGEGQ